METIDQKKLDRGETEGGETLTGFKTASLERNRELHMFKTKPAQSRETAASKGSGTKGSSKSRSSIAERKRRELMVTDKDWGNWQKHSSGFASKMMKKVIYYC